MDKIDKQLSEIREIKKLMERSSKFISLSGLSGVFAGIIAILGAAIGYFLFYSSHPWIFSRDYYTDNYFETRIILSFLLCVAILIVALSGATYFTIKKARKQGLTIWNTQAWQLILSLSIPLFCGGLFCILLLVDQIYFLIAPSMLIFYGLALINASKFAVHEIKLLGISEIILGFICGFLQGWGLVFWTLGFGLLHIVYGIIMYYKYDK